MEENASILIVDDDESACRSLALIFGKKGYKAITAGTGREAIEKAKEKAFNLALLDIKLPDMEGTELLTPLKRIQPDMAVLMVTAYASMDTAIQSLNDGASAYITKPLNMDEVLSAVRGILEKQRLVVENRRLEERLQQAQRMEAIGTLAGGIAHDFNNILSLIIGYTELAMIDLNDDGPAGAKMKDVLKAAVRARDLVKQVLAFSRQSEHEKKPIQIHLIVKEALKLLRASLPTNIEIHQNIATTGAMLADPTQIHQVIMNLFTNAYDAMREKGGVLEVGLEEVEVDHEFTTRHLDLNPGPYLRLTVHDTGQGMERAVMDRVFEPYYSTREKGGGTGMGLAVSHGIVKSHGGAISVSSNPGEGTTFHVFFPKIEAPESMAESKKLTDLPKGSERILFIDDEHPMVDMGKRMLEHLGYEVATRTNGIEALEAFRAQPDKYDLVITDMTMPMMTGDELTKELILIRSDIPVILCTGFSDRITEEKAKEIGVKEFVMKPINMSEMARTVRKALG